MDKTALIRQLTEGDKRYFLSRPRRFGKSLLLDTIKELFEGNEALLFQTGYLRILEEREDQRGRIRYRLGYPNQEVRQSLNERLLMALLPDAARRRADDAPPG